MKRDGRQHKVKVVRYEPIKDDGTVRHGPYDTAIWRLTLTCGHTVVKASGREVFRAQYGTRTIDGRMFDSVVRDFECPTCRAAALETT